MSKSKELQQSKRLRTKQHISWTVAFLVRRWRIELILLISTTERWTTNMVNMLCHGQGSVNVNPETLDMAIERNIMTANSQVAILWRTDTKIKVHGQKLETVTSFKYLGSVITDEGSKLEMLSRIVQTTAALTWLKPVWNERSISLSSKMRLMRSHVTFIFLYACESWTLTAELQRRDMNKTRHGNECYRKILRISYKDHITNEEVYAKIQQAIGPHEDLLTIVKRRKLQWYEHVSRSSRLAKTILQGTVKDKADRGRGGKTTSGNGQAWSSPSPRGQWRTGKREKTGGQIICGAPTTLAVNG